MMYAGHHPDGSSIQKHSAGSAYPFIVRTQECHEDTGRNDGAQVGYGYADVIDSLGNVVNTFLWRLHGEPSKVKADRLRAYEQAHDAADRLAAIRRAA